MIEKMTPASVLHSFRVLTFLDCVMGSNEFGLTVDRISNVVMGSFDNRCGDSFYTFFKGREAIIYGLAHESDAWTAVRKGLISTTEFFKGVPSSLMACLGNPPMRLEEASFCLWYTEGPNWKSNCLYAEVPSVWWPEDPDGSKWLLGHLDLSREAFDHDFFERFIEVLPKGYSLPEQFLTLRNVTVRDVVALNPMAEPNACIRELARLLAIEPPP